MSATAVPGPRQRRLRSLARVSIAALLLAALVLGVLVRNAIVGDPVTRADVAEIVPLQAQPYGAELTVVLPGSEVTVVAGAPVDRIGYDLLEVEYDDPRWEDADDLGAPEGGSLVPVSWSTRQLGGLLSKDDPTPVVIRLVAGDQRVELDSVVFGDSSATLDAYDGRSVAVGVAGEPDLDDLALEVEYAGLTQTAHVGSGRIDAGVAQVLYDGERDFTAGCTEVDDQCALVAADPASPVRPDRATFTASHLTLYPYDADLGWAADGTLWAGVRLQLFGSSGLVNAAGRTWSVRGQSAPVITLDGAEPVDREGLKASTFDSNGRVVFRVDDDTDPSELGIEQLIAAKGPGAPADLPVTTRLALTPVG